MSRPATAFLRRLSRFARVTTFDKRGQGLSDRIAGAASLETRMDDVRAVMDAVGSRRAVLLGLSEGAPMSALFAATYPDRVSHLILSGGYAKLPPADLVASAQRLDAVVKAWGSGASIKRARSPDKPVSEEGWREWIEQSQGDYVERSWRWPKIPSALTTTSRSWLGSKGTA
jgi:pimeloyl-ACP methyl ester carboxylesterase